MRPSTLRKFVAEPNFEEKLLLHKIDSLASAGHLENYNYTNEFVTHLKKQGSLELPKPLITGTELKSLGLKPGKNFGQLLKELQELQLNRKITTQDDAVAWVKNKIGIKYE
jgi:hypothetical protein